MKTVYLDRDFYFPLHPRRTVRFHAGVTYDRVLEIAAREIERKGAGRIVPKPFDAAGIIDAGHAFPDPLLRCRQPRNKRKPLT